MAVPDSLTGEPLAPEASEVSARTRIHLVVAAIPEGRVSTYGEVAAFAGLPRQARRVGRTLSELPAASRLPWHRVVRADGRIAPRGAGEDEQRRRLMAEGIPVHGQRVDLGQYRWQP